MDYVKIKNEIRRKIDAKTANAEDLKVLEDMHDELADKISILGKQMLDLNLESRACSQMMNDVVEVIRNQ